MLKHFPPWLPINRTRRSMASFLPEDATDLFGGESRSDNA